MPLFLWECQSCGTSSRKLLEERPLLPPCPACGGEQRFTTQATSRVIEIRDNGFMPRKVEQLANVQDLVRRRSTPEGEDDII